MTEFRVMLVDDEKDFRETLCKRLKKRKLDVISAGSGREALARLEEEPVDVVVLDVRMPDMIMRAIVTVPKTKRSGSRAGAPSCHPATPIATTIAARNRRA